MTLGGRLKMARVNADMSLKDVAEKLGISKQGVGHWELDRSEPTITNLAKVAGIYNVRLEWLVTAEGQMQKEAGVQGGAGKLSYSSADRQTELLDTMRTMRAAGLLIARVTIDHDSIMIETRDQSRHKDTTDSGNS
jgi:transcriptional regulator with XRE-family HTH domain